MLINLSPILALRPLASANTTAVTPSSSTPPSILPNPPFLQRWKRRGISFSLVVVWLTPNATILLSPPAPKLISLSKSSVVTLPTILPIFALLPVLPSNLSVKLTTLPNFSLCPKPAVLSFLLTTRTSALSQLKPWHSAVRSLPLRVGEPLRP